MAFIAFALTIPANACTTMTRMDINENRDIVFCKYEECTDGKLVPSRIELGTFATRQDADHHVYNEIFKFAKNNDITDIYGKDWNDGTFGPYKYIVESDDFCVNRNKDFGGTEPVHFAGHIHFCIKEID